MTDEQDSIHALFTACRELKKLGWRDPHHGVDWPECLMIEMGSTGIHRGTYGDGQYWFADEIGTCTPVLVKKVGGG